MGNLRSTLPEFDITQPEFSVLGLFSLVDPRALHTLQRAQKVLVRILPFAKTAQGQGEELHE